jgi:hypothetical protein
MPQELSPLLSGQTNDYQASSNSHNDESIIIATSRTPSLKSIVSTNGDDITISQANEDLLKKRLNGASIYAVFTG